MVAKNLITFSDITIKKIPIPEKGRVDYRDEKNTKLTCRVASSGAKTFAVSTWHDNSSIRVTLGQFPIINVTIARKLALDTLSALAKGVDINAEKQARRRSSSGADSLSQMLIEYISNRDLKPSTAENYTYKLKLGFAPWLKKSVKELTEQMIVDRQKWITENKGRTTANTTCRVLRLTLNYAAALKIIPHNPARVLSEARLWHKDRRRSRIISTQELHSWHEAVCVLPNVRAKVYLLMGLYMGLRKSDLLPLQWAHVNLKQKSLIAINTKNRSDLFLPIPDVLIPYIEELMSVTGQHEWVFSGYKNAGNPMSEPKPHYKTVTKFSGVEFSSHDMRRTFATIAEAVGTPMSMIKRLVNHVTDSDVTGGYIITEDATLRLAINKIADYIQSQVTTK